VTAFAESHVEDAVLAGLAELGHGIALGPIIGRDTAASERKSYGDVVLVGRLRAAIARLNLAPDIQAEAFRWVLRTETPSLIEENRRLQVRQICA
jgi:type I restriction enzyme R subunit